MLNYFPHPILDSAIPPKQRTRLLKPLLDKCYEKLKRVSPQFAQLPLTLILKLWDSEDPTFRPNEFDQIRSMVDSWGIEGEKFRNELLTELNQILKEDSHLSVCCGGEPLNLATAIDLFYLSELIRTSTAGYGEKLDTIYYPIFENRIYLTQYKRAAIFHLFNFDIEGTDKLTFDDWTLENISQYFIPTLLGESTPFSRLHPPDIGNYFLVCRDSASPKDTSNWLDSKYREALGIQGLLQYFKDEIVHIDYYTVLYQPDWVNTIWRMGTYFFGNIRRASVTPKYKLLDEDVPKIQTLWMAYKKNYDKLSKLSSSKLGQAILRADRHFSNYHSKDRKEEQFIELIIALESLFSPAGATQELTYRISQYASIFLGKEENVFGTYEFIKDMLVKRGSLFHGQYDVVKVENDQFLSAEEIKRFASYIRCAILGFIILYLRNEWNLEEIQGKLVKALFDFEIRNEIRNKAHLELFLQETINN